MITRHDIVNNVTRFGESVWELPTVVLRGQSKTAGNTGLKELPGTLLNQRFVLSIYICAERQFSASNPPNLLAGKPLEQGL